jgi:hypothetical protein
MAALGPGCVARYDGPQGGTREIEMGSTLIGNRTLYFPVFSRNFREKSAVRPRK